MLAMSSGISTIS